MKKLLKRQGKKNAVALVFVFFPLWEKQYVAKIKEKESIARKKPKVKD